MKTGQLALGILAISLCIWATNAASSPTTTEATTTTAATTTTTTAATTTTTTSSSSSSSSKVHRKRFRIKNLKYSIKRRVRVYRATSASSTSRNRNRNRNRSGRRVSVRRLNRLLRGRNQG
ncbi:protein new-glue 3 [Drosophila mauritiana]|uniref:Protein new-glue 3 n=1 Tax=Drosophila mauritiana TaxID=7226 RepID=A0A6P8KFI1_DROMA|nr:protein new-glue 3 [Drosophila mauritiana]